MKRVILESPLAGSGLWPMRLIRRWLNIRYARRCLRHSLSMGEAPIASHLLYPQVLDDDDPVERRWGIAAGLEWGDVADATVVYTDRGMSRGRFGVEHANQARRPVEYRTLRPVPHTRETALGVTPGPLPQ